MCLKTKEQFVGVVHNLHNFVFIMCESFSKKKNSCGVYKIYRNYLLFILFIHYFYFYFYVSTSLKIFYARVYFETDSPNTWNNGNQLNKFHKFCNFFIRVQKFS